MIRIKNNSELLIINHYQLSYISKKVNKSSNEVRATVELKKDNETILVENIRISTSSLLIDIFLQLIFSEKRNLFSESFLMEFEEFYQVLNQVKATHDNRFMFQFVTDSEMYFYNGHLCSISKELKDKSLTNVKLYVPTGNKHWYSMIVNKDYLDVPIEESFDLLSDVDFDNFSFFDNTLSSVSKNELFNVLTKSIKEVEPSYLFFL